MRITSKISRGAIAALFAVAILGPAASPGDVIETETPFFLRGTGCGAETDLYLLNTAGDDEYDGCGTIGGIPFNEALAQLGGQGETLTARNMDSIVLDATRQVTVQIRTESWLGNGIPGAGESIVDISINGTAPGSFIPTNLGSGSSTKIVAGADNATHTFTFDLPASLHEVELTGMSIDVSWHGVNWNVNNLGMSGDSFFVVPTLEIVE